MSKKLDDMLIEAVHATGPRTNSHKITDYMKSKRYYHIPALGHIGNRIQQLGVARPTGRRVRVDHAKGSTITEYEVVE